MRYILDIARDGSVRIDGRRVVSTDQAARRLGRSRRHFYRFIQRGWLSPVATFARQHFFDARDVEALRPHRASRRMPSISRRLAPLFPEYDWRSLRLDRDADIILTRILERGDPAAVRWAHRHFSTARKEQALRAQGRRLLSPRALRFWSWLWKVPVASHKGNWRQSGRSLGGIA